VALAFSVTDIRSRGESASCKGLDPARNKRTVPAAGLDSVTSQEYGGALECRFAEWDTWHRELFPYPD